VFGRETGVRIAMAVCLLHQRCRCGGCGGCRCTPRRFDVS